LRHAPFTAFRVTRKLEPSRQDNFFAFSRTNA
jgi:hypothetical protein